MAAPCYIAWNGTTSALTAPVTAVATSAVSGTVKTMLQVKSPTSSKIRIVEWGYMITTSPAAPLTVELIETGTVFATVTTGNILQYNDVTGYASLCTTGTAATGFTASAEGSITATRLFAQNYELGTEFHQQFPLGREPEVNEASALRIRCTPSSAAALSISCYIVWEE
jgi:hypothetical protein